MFKNVNSVPQKNLLNACISTAVLAMVAFPSMGYAGEPATDPIPRLTQNKDLKILQLSVSFPDKSSAIVGSKEPTLVYGAAPTRLGLPDELQFRFYDAAKNELARYNSFDVFEEHSHNHGEGGDQHSHDQSPIERTFSLPFHKDAESVTLFRKANTDAPARSLVSINIASALQKFCGDNATDDDCKGVAPIKDDKKGYWLTCRGGGKMRILVNHDVNSRGVPGDTAMFVYFDAASRANTPKAGECVWKDRTFRGGEPTVLWQKSRNIEFAFQVNANGTIVKDTTGPRMNVEGATLSAEAARWDKIVKSVLTEKPFEVKVYNADNRVMVVTDVR